MKRRSAIALIAVIAVIAASAVGAYTAIKYVSSGGTQVRKYVDRLNVTVSRTRFDFDLVESGAAFVCDTDVEIEKAEPEFYGRLISMNVIGGAKSVVYTAFEENGDALVPENVLLTSTDGSPDSFGWNVSFAVPYEPGKNEYDLTLRLTYETGVSELNKDIRECEIPLKVALAEGVTE